MKLIIAGSRDITDIHVLIRALQNNVSRKDVEMIISGGARGVDTLAQTLATNSDIPFTLCEANWEEHGKSAGYRRNIEMAEIGTTLLAIWDGESKGTSHMIDIAHKKGLDVKVELVKGLKKI